MPQHELLRNPPNPITHNLPMRKEEVVSGGFILQVILGLIVLLGAVSLGLKWIAKRFPARFSTSSPKHLERNIHILSTTRLSMHTRLILVEISGFQAIITETGKTSELQFLPGKPDNSPTISENFPKT